MKIRALLSISTILLIPAMPSAFAVDFIQEIDATVVGIHDYSVLSGKLDKANTVQDAKSIASSMNAKLAVIRKNLVAYDADLSYNWKVLIDNDNVNYPHRQLLKEFNKQGFTWFNYELSIQSKLSNCFKQKSGILECVKKNRTAAKKIELKNYADLTDTLDSIASWRKQYNR